MLLSGCCGDSKRAYRDNSNDVVVANNKSTKARNTNIYTQKQDSYPNPRHVPNLQLIKEPEPRYEPKSRCGNPKQYTVFNKTYKVLNSSLGYKEKGYASWYGTKFHGFRTSSGETYDMYAMTAAHKTLPLPTYARVTNLANKRSVIVKINDRGPFCDGRIVDLSYTAASKLGILAGGVGQVEVVAINPKEFKSKPASPTREPNVQLASNNSLQLGAFTVQQNAKNLANKLENLLAKHYGPNQKNYTVNIVKHDLQNQAKKNILYKVTVNSISQDVDLSKLKSILSNLQRND